MRAAILHDFERGPVLEEVTVEAPRAGEVLVRLAASGVCGSDVHAVHGRANVLKNMPMVLGHEGAGVIEEVGPGIADLKRGDHVVIAMYGPCGICGTCSSGKLHFCEGPEMRSVYGEMPDGSTRLSLGGAPAYPFVGVGSMAEYAVVRRSMIVKVKPDLPLDTLCITACALTTGLGAVFNVADIRPGATVAVIGCGGVGMSVIQGARIAGASRIIAIDRNPAKLNLAADLGASHCLTAGEDGAETIAAVKRIVPRGVDYAFEVVGSKTLIQQALAMTARGGAVVMIGVVPWGEDIAINAGLMFDRRLLGCLGGHNIPGREIPRIIDLYETGRLKLDELVGHKYPLSDIRAAFANAERAEDIRTVVTIDPRLL